MRKTAFRSSLLITVSFLLIPFMVFGQDLEDVCRAFISGALSETGNNCANLGAGEICYAFGDNGELSATYIDSDGVSTPVTNGFNVPGDRIPALSDTQVIEGVAAQALALDANNPDNSSIGIAIAEVAGNLPQQIPQNTTVLILFGGARVENGVPFAETLAYADAPVSVTTNGSVSLFGSPVGLGYNVPDTEITMVDGAFEADGVSPDGEWVRVFAPYEREYGQRATAWLSVADLSAPTDLDTLPVIGPSSFTPLQNLFLTSEPGTLDCESTLPSSMILQGPDETEVDFQVNGVPVRLTSTAGFQMNSQNQLVITTISGFIVLFPDTPDEVVIPAGLSGVLNMIPGDFGVDGQGNNFSWNGNTNVPLNNAGISNFSALPGLPGNILNYSLPNVAERVCASGIGGPICTIILPPDDGGRVVPECQAGLLPEEVCELLGL